MLNAKVTFRNVPFTEDFKDLDGVEFAGSFLILSSKDKTMVYPEHRIYEVELNGKSDDDYSAG